MPPIVRPPLTRVRRVTRSAEDTSPIILAVSPNADLVGGGTTITLTGRYFATDSAGNPPVVEFGGVPATGVVVVSPTEITATAPAHAFGLVSVEVTDDHARTGLLEFSFTYKEPKVISFTPDNGPLAGGTTVQIKGANFSPGMSIYFGGNLASAITFIDNQTYSVVTPSHAVGPAEILVDTTAAASPFYFTFFTRGEDIRRNPSIRITEHLGNAPNTCTFVVDGKSSPPKAGEVIEITDSQDPTSLLFAGVVQMVDQEYEGQVSQLAWRVAASDYTFWLNRKRPFGFYNKVSATQIVKDLVTRYAPWVDTTYVQSNLCKVYISFDGTEDFATALSRLARMLGGGHWYLDYERKLHFFHLVPANIPTSFTPEGVVEDNSGSQPGIGTAMDLAEGPTVTLGQIALANVYLYGWTTFIYDNGLESAFSPISPIVFFNGLKHPQFTNIPIGAPVGGLTVVARKIYLHLNGMGGAASQYGLVKINDNTTTTWTGTVTGSPMLAALNPGVSFVTDRGIPARPFIAPPAAPPESVGVAASGLTTEAAFAAFGVRGSVTVNHSYTPGNYRFRLTHVYKDGTESLPGPWSETIALDGQVAVDFFVPEAASNSLNGVALRFRKIYTSFGWPGQEPFTTYAAGNIAPTDNELRFTLAPAVFALNAQSNEQGAPGIGSVSLVDPCVDGPYLEDTLPQPADLDSSNTDLLRDTPLQSSVDVSQLRNRIFIRGGGTPTIIAAAAIGEQTLNISDPSAFSATGGNILIGNNLVRSRAVSTINPGLVVITLDAPLQFEVPIGTLVRGTIIVNDVESQQAMGLIEREDDGSPGDGIHEFMIDDPTLINIEQMLARGWAELELFAKPIVTVRYSTRDPLTIPGRKINIDLEDPPTKGQFLIQSVDIDQIHDESDQVGPRYTASASSVKFDLEDLLLLISASIKASATATGLVEAAVTEAGDNVPTVVLGEGTVLTVTKTLTQADIQTLNTVPIVAVVGAAGYIIQPIYMIIRTAQYQVDAFNAQLYNTSRTIALRYRLATNPNDLMSATAIFGGGGIGIYPIKAVNRLSRDIGTFPRFEDPATDAEGKDLIIRGSGNVTGGNSKDVITVKIFYWLLEQFYLSNP